MIKVQIKKQDVVTNSAEFPSMEEAQAWLDKHEGMKTFGEPERTVQQQVELVPAVLDEDGVEISPAQYEMQEVVIPGSYEVSIEDVSAQKAQEAINAEALAYLADTDWMVLREADGGQAMPAEIKAERAAARARIVR